MDQKDSSPPILEIDPRFIYKISRLNKKTKRYEHYPALNADGHIDYAYRSGLDGIKTEIISENLVQGADGSFTHWVTIKATVNIFGKTFMGMACSNSRVVQEAGYEVAIAETRAIKRAIAVACNITEKVINPSGSIPTRDIVDIPLEEEPSHEIPHEIIRAPDDILTDSDQFEV
jgi:hypothetical protein